MIPSAKEKPARADAWRRSLPAIVFGVCLVVYVWHSAPTVRDWDAAERALTLHGLGLSHPPGCPLYTLVGHVFASVFFFLPLERAANLLSAVSTAAAMAWLAALLLRLAPDVRAAGAAALTAAFHPMIWSQAIYSEVYSLHLLFLTGFAWYFARWVRGRDDRDLVAATLLYGLTVMVHMSSALWAPSIMLFLVWRRRGVFARPRLLLAVAAALVVGLTPILYIYLRGSVAMVIGSDARPDSLAQLIRYLRGAQFKEMNAPEPVLLAKRSIMLAALLLYGYLGVLFAPVVVGAWRWLRRDPAASVSVALGCLLFVAYFGSGRSFDFKTLVLPVFLPLAAAGAEGWRWALGDGGEKRNAALCASDSRESISPPRSESRSLRLRRIALWMSMAGPVVQVLLFPTVQRGLDAAAAKRPGNRLVAALDEAVGHAPVTFRGDTWPRDAVRALDAYLGANVPGEVTVIANWDYYTPIVYYQAARGWAPRATVYQILSMPIFRAVPGGEDEPVPHTGHILDRDLPRRPCFLVWDAPEFPFPGYDSRHVATLPGPRDNLHLHRILPAGSPAS